MARLLDCSRTAHRDMTPILVVGELVDDYNVVVGNPAKAR
jgi:hypothetical protein